jgi:hypothetical protein
MPFFHLPVGHAEWRVDRRDPRPSWVAAESLARRRNHARSKP